MGDQERKTETGNDTDREPTIRDLDLTDKDGEKVKGGAATTILPKK